MEAAAVSPELLQQIGNAIRSMRYGTVQITVHNARVAQIDKVERVRFAPAADLTTDRTPPSPPADRTSGDARPHGR